MVINFAKMRRLLYYLTWFMFVVGFLINNFHIPNGIMYIYDIFFAFSVLFCARRIQERVSRTGIRLPFYIFIAVVFCAAIGFFVNRYSPTILLNGIRTNFRVFVVFICAAIIADGRFSKNIYHTLYSFFWLNVIACTFQYFIFGVRGDYCNGLFGVAKMNSWTNVLLCIIVAHSISSYINKSITLKKTVIPCMACLYIATLAELKFFYFELVIIAAMVIFLNRPSLRTAVMCIVGAVAMIGAITLFNSMWEVKGASMFSIEGIQNYFTEKSYGYSSVGDWGRIGGIGKATEKFFSSGVNLFGFGIGACGYGTHFQVTYEYLHYMWFGYLTIFLEQGYVGLILYATFFVGVLIAAKKRKDRTDNVYIKSMFDVTECMSVIAIILIFYNSTILNYPAMLLCVVAALPFNINEDEINRENFDRMVRVIPRWIRIRL